MFLCPSNVTVNKKREGITTIWSWSGDDFPTDCEWLAPEVLSGVGSGGTSYNTNRWREFVIFIQIRLIDRYSSKQRQLNCETWLMQETLDARWFDVVFLGTVSSGWPSQGR